MVATNVWSKTPVLNVMGISPDVIERWLAHTERTPSVQRTTTLTCCPNAER